MDYNFFGNDEEFDDQYGGDEDDDYTFNPFGGDYDERVIDEGPTYEAEIGAFERTGAGGRLGTTIVGGIIGDIQQKMSRELSTPDERFKIYVDSISRKLNLDDILSISNQDIDVMLDKADLVKGIQYVNPTAYILGFMATRGGRSMDNIHKIIKKLPMIGDAGVEAPDVVRYSRYWTMYLR